MKLIQQWKSYKQSQNVIRQINDNIIISTGTVRARLKLAKKCLGKNATMQTLIDHKYLTHAEVIRLAKIQPWWDRWVLHCYIEGRSPIS
jgi:hypothetical protein